MQNKRTIAQLKEQYKIEKEFSNRIRFASRDKRSGLYSKTYDEFFRTVPAHHTQIRKKKAHLLRRLEAKIQFHQIEAHLTPNSTFLDIGAGDCALSFEVAKYVKRVFAVDVSNQIVDNSNIPENVEIIISDGISIPVEEGSIDFAYSNQVIEHLHPDDGREHMDNVFRSLSPGGHYFVITPNRINGPHDISKYFDKSAKGFHLKEYTLGELNQLFRAIGYTSVKKVFNVKGHIIISPLSPLVWLEKVLMQLPERQCQALSRTKPVHFALYIKLLGKKGYC
jgi:SAM-dependent methyltransferase